MIKPDDDDAPRAVQSDLRRLFGRALRLATSPLKAPLSSSFFSDALSPSPLSASVFMPTRIASDAGRLADSGIGERAPRTENQMASFIVRASAMSACSKSCSAVRRIQYRVAASRAFGVVRLSSETSGSAALKGRRSGWARKMSMGVDDESS